MPKSLLPEFIARLESLEIKMGQHLEESGEIRSDLKWLKWLVMGISAGWGSIAIAVAMYLLKLKI